MKGLLPHEERRTRHGLGMLGFPVDRWMERGTKRKSLPTEEGETNQYTTELHQFKVRMWQLSADACDWDVQSSNTNQLVTCEQAGTSKSICN